MRTLSPLIVVSLCLASCKDPPPPTPATTTPPSSAAPSTSSSVASARCDVTLLPGEKVVTADGAEEQVPAGKPLGISAETGKTYCLLDKKLTTATKLADARAMVPPECTVDDRLGSSHLLCRAIGLRLSFVGPEQRFSYFDLFARDTDPFPAMPSPSTSASVTPMTPGCDVMLVPGVRVQFPLSAQDVTPATPVAGEPMAGKTYCVFGGKVTSKTSYGDAQKLAPKTCKLVTVKGGWHLVCSKEGLRLSFGSADGLLFRYSLFTGGPDAGMP